MPFGGQPMPVRPGNPATPAIPPSFPGGGAPGGPMPMGPTGFNPGGGQMRRPGFSPQMQAMMGQFRR
jgi:hypothetical protein